jgi:hypothetical protein
VLDTLARFTAGMMMRGTEGLKPAPSSAESANHRFRRVPFRHRDGGVPRCQKAVEAGAAARSITTLAGLERHGWRARSARQQSALGVCRTLAPRMLQKSADFVPRYQKFESTSLQRRVERTIGSAGSRKCSRSPG